MRALVFAAATLAAATLVFFLATRSSPVDRTPLSAEPEAESSHAPLLGAPPSKEVSEPAAADEAPRSADPPTPALLHGRITDSNGELLDPHVACGVVSPEGKVHVAFYRPATGHYAHANVLPGVYRFRAIADGYETHDAMFEIPKGVKEFEHSIRLDPLVSIPVRFVTPDGKPLRDAVPGTRHWISHALSVVASNDQPPARLRATTAAAHHAYGRGDYAPVVMERDPSLRDGRDGTLRIRGDMPVQIGVYLRRERLQVRRLERVPKQLDFEVKPETIERLLSAFTFRLTVAGDRAQLDDLAILLNDDSRDPEEVVFERNDDQFTVNRRPPGNLHLQMDAGDALESFFRNIDLPPGGLLDLGTIHLGPPQRQSIRIVDANDKPVPGATVWPHDRDIGWMAYSAMPVRFTSDAKGIVRLALGAHRWGLLIREPAGGCCTTEIDLRSDHPDVVAVQLPRFVRVSVRTGSAELPVSVRFLDEHDHVVVARKLSKPTIWPLALPKGTYTMIITDRDGVERSESRQVGGSNNGMIVIE